MAWKPPSKQRLANRVTSGVSTQGKTGGAAAPPVKSGSSRPAVTAGLHPEVVNAIEQPIKWSAPKLNSQKGNGRAGAYYREGTDPKTGDTLHLYQEEAGGIPREIFRLKKKLAKKV